MEDELVAAGRYARLETRGRVTGLPRVVTIGFVEERDGAILVAARPGAHWADNLLADPRCVVTVGERSWPAVAEELDGPEFASGDPGAHPALRHARRDARPRPGIPRPAGGEHDDQGGAGDADRQIAGHRVRRADRARPLPQWLIATGVTRVEQLDPGHSPRARGCVSISAWPAGRRRSRGR